MTTNESIILVCFFVILFTFVGMCIFNPSKDIAEFEAEHCPEMLKVESKYCLPK